jgi:WD40 repeat protein
VLSGQAGQIASLAFSPDSRWLSTASADGSARVWDLRAANPAEQPLILHGHDGALTAAAISPDSRLLITGSSDQSVRLWELPPQTASDRSASVDLLSATDLIDQACKIAGRNLTEDEWQQVFPGNTYRKTCPQLPR